MVDRYYILSNGTVHTRNPVLEEWVTKRDTVTVKQALAAWQKAEQSPEDRGWYDNEPEIERTC